MSKIKVTFFVWILFFSISSNGFSRGLDATFLEKSTSFSTERNEGDDYTTYQDSPVHDDDTCQNNTPGQCSGQICSFTNSNGNTVYGSCASWYDNGNHFHCACNGPVPDHVTYDPQYNQVLWQPDSDVGMMCSLWQSGDENPPEPSDIPTCILTGDGQLIILFPNEILN